MRIKLTVRELKAKLAEMNDDDELIATCPHGVDVGIVIVWDCGSAKSAAKREEMLDYYRSRICGLL